MADEAEVRVRTKRLFERSANDSSIEPLFVNNIEITHGGTDVFMDFGMVRPDDILHLREEMQKGGEIEVPFHVTQRIAMSVGTFLTLQEKITRIFEAIKKKDAVEDAIKR